MIRRNQFECGYGETNTETDTETNSKNLPTSRQSCAKAKMFSQMIRIMSNQCIQFEGRLNYGGSVDFVLYSKLMGYGIDACLWLLPILI
jgi:hypothetical protein